MNALIGSSTPSIARRVRRSAAPLLDPHTVEQAVEAGVGRDVRRLRLDMRLQRPIPLELGRSGGMVAHVRVDPCTICL
jgi:hypothetical protein